MSARRLVLALDEPPPSGESDRSGDDVAQLGGKGASLQRLHREGLPVPPGFIIAVDACREFLATGVFPASLDSQIDAGLSRLETQAGRTLGEGLRLAVRGGAAESLPGLLRTVLNVGAGTSGPAPDMRAGESAHPGRRPAGERPLEDDARAVFLRPLREAIESVWKSWTQAHAALVRSGRTPGAADGTAVVVQVMIDAESSGVAFSRHPAPSRPGVMIEAVPGLGEDLVSGRATPFCLLVDPDPARLASGSSPLEHTAATAPSASPGDVGKLASLPVSDPPVSDPPGPARPPGLSAALAARIAEDARRIERLFGAPVDVEWAIAQRRLWYLQARPIAETAGASGGEEHTPSTAAKEPAAAIAAAASGSAPAARSAAEHDIEAALSSGRRLVRHNLDETLPSPTPLTWSVWRDFMRGAGGYGALLRTLGYAPSSRACREGFLERVGGRIYADVDRLREMYCTGFPWSFNLARLKAHPDRLSGAPDLFDIERLDPWFLLKAPWTFGVMLRAAWRTRRLLRTFPDRFDRIVLPAAIERLDRYAAEPPPTESLATAAAGFEASRRLVFDELGPGLFLPAALATVVEARLSANLQIACGADEAPRLLVRLLQEVRPLTPDADPSLSSGMSYELRPHSNCGEAGGRGGGQEAPATNFRRPAPDDERDVLAETLRAHRSLVMLPRIAPDVRLLRRLLEQRETARRVVVRGLDLLRAAAREIGRRNGLHDDVFFLEASELGAPWPPGKFRDVAAARRRLYEELLQADPPLVLDGSDRQPPSARRAAGSTPPLNHAGNDILRGRRRGYVDVPGPLNELPGRPLSGGVAAGVARHWNGLDRLVLQPDQIVVAQSVTPEAMLHLAAAAGLVVEQGGALSHAAIWARRLGIAVVQCESALVRIPEGARLEIDGDRGLVTVGGS